MSYAGTEQVVVDFLAADLGVRVCTELPADLGDVLPLVQVVRVGGSHHDNSAYFHTPTVSIDCFDRTRLDATDLALRVDLALRLRLQGATVLGSNIGRIRTLAGPSFRPWDDTTLRRFGATYQLWIKAPTA